MDVDELNGQKIAQKLVLKQKGLHCMVQAGVKFSVDSVETTVESQIKAPEMKYKINTRSAL